MSTNSEIAEIFSGMAAVLELTGANPFRVNAHVRVARTLRDLTVDVATLADDSKKLTAIEGIGAGSAKKIIEFVETGDVKEYRALLAEIPEGLIALLGVQGLGPKTVKMVWEQAGVTNLASLEAAIDSGALLDLPRLGAKSIENIRESLRFAARTADRVRIGAALPIAEAIVGHLASVKGTRRIEYAGSLRRGRDTIGDIDILAASAEPEGLSEAFRSMPGVEKVLAAGTTKSSIRLEAGLQVDLRIVGEEAFGAALMYFTGSKQHNVRLRERATKRKMRLNEYGLFPDDGNDEPPQQRGIAPIAAVTEADVYAALDVPFVPPEMREDRGEIGVEPPALVTVEDVKAELHAHTVASDGRMTLEQLVDAARQRRFHTIAVTDHSKSSAQANGLSEDRLRAHIEMIHEANAAADDITILAGSEVDILSDGRLDYDDDLLAALDIVVASPHAALTQDPEKATKRLLAAIRHPLVHIIGHPTGRLINRRPGLSPDIESLVAAAAENDTALEINANDRRLDLRDTHVRAAVEAGAPIAINTDAHSADNFDLLRYGIMTARRGWLTAEGCINTWPAKRLHAWLRNKR